MTHKFKIFSVIQFYISRQQITYVLYYEKYFFIKFQKLIQKVVA